MTLAEYLASEQAREDVRLVVAKPHDVLRYSGNGGPWLERTTLKAWTRLGIEGADQYITAYYRPDGDRYVVTDLGEGVRTACLRGLDLANAEHFERLNALGRTLDADFRQTAPLGWIELRDITAADLPDAICRVMLASLKVSEVQP